jgi:hypothetical protein
MIYLLHIPRTGGVSRREIFDGVDGITLAGHAMRLSDVPIRALPVVFVRDPVARFVSAYAHLRESWVHDIEGETLLDRWPSANALARSWSLAVPFVMKQTRIFVPQAAWMDTARAGYVFRTEEMLYGVRCIFEDLGLIPAPETVPVLNRSDGSVDDLDDRGRRNIERYYRDAGDYRLWDSAMTDDR